MAWNPSSNTLTRGFTKIAANGQGDLQKALNRSVMRHLQLVCDIDGNGNRVNAINPAARYKPFCYDGTFATEAAREAARVARNCGLTMSRVAGTAQQSGLANMWSGGIQSGNNFAWAYEPPRENQASEPKRVNDFINENSDTRGYCSTAKFQFNFCVLPNPTNRWSIPPKVQLPTDVMLSADAIALSDLQGDGSQGYTSTNHKYFGLAGFYYTIAIGEHGASGPEWVMSYPVSTLETSTPEVTFFNNKTSSKYYDIVFFFFKPVDGGSVYNGGTAPLAGEYILAAYPYEYFYFDYSLGITTTAIMNSARNSIALSIAASGADIPYDHISLNWMDGQTARTASFTRDAGTLTQTAQNFTASYASGWPSPSPTFYIRIYTSSSAYKEQELPVMESA